MTKDTFLPYGRQSIQPEDIRAVTKALKKSSITRGDTVVEFEEAIAAYCGAQYAVAFSSGSAALAAGMFALAVGRYDEVVTTPNTFVSTLGTAVQRGARPCFVDIDRSTGNIDVKALCEVINAPLSRGQRIVIPVHFAGRAVDMQAIETTTSLRNVSLLEDAAHALGSLYPSGERVGCCRWSRATIFSFHAVKNITTGEGGMVTTNDPEVAHRLRLFRNNGIEREKEHFRCDLDWRGYYEVEEYTNNYHLTDFQAALGLSQFGQLDRFAANRQKLVALYRERLERMPQIRLFDPAQDSLTTPHLFVVQIDFEGMGCTRKECMERLYQEGIGTQLHYIPLYRHPIFRRVYGDISDRFPSMEGYFAQALSLPLFYGMEEEDIDRVVKALELTLDPFL